MCNRTDDDLRRICCSHHHETNLNVVKKKEKKMPFANVHLQIAKEGENSEENFIYM